MRTPNSTCSSASERLDTIGVFASVGCALHCMAAPLLLLLAPTLGGWWVHPASHLIISFLVLPVAAFSLRRGFRLHGRRVILGVGVLGMAMVSISVALPWVFPTEAVAAGCDACADCGPTASYDGATGAWSFSIPPASLLSLLGGVALIAAHIGNLHWSRTSRCCS